MSKVAAQVYYQLSDNEDVMEPESPVRIVSSDNAESLAAEMITFVTHWLDNVDWLNKVFNRILASQAKVGLF